MERYDVIEVDITSGEIVRFMAEDLDERNATAVTNMAVIRRGVEHSFYATVLRGSVRLGDHWGER